MEVAAGAGTGQNRNMTKPTSTVRAYLEGGPDDLPERIVPVTGPSDELKIPHLNGYEHFRATARRTDTTEGDLAVFEWFERTEKVS
jgi:hypothetical protein